MDKKKVVLAYSGGLEAALAESLNGPQISGDWTVNVGWEYAF